MSGLGRALEIYFECLLHPGFWEDRRAETTARNWIELFKTVRIYKFCPLVQQLLYRLNQYDAVTKLMQKEKSPLGDCWKSLLK